jgi:hypothetical protein
MAVTLYGNYIDYNGNRTFVAVGNCGYAGYNCGDPNGTIEVGNCNYLNDSGETVVLSGGWGVNCQCNCACNC